MRCRNVSTKLITWIIACVLPCADTIAENYIPAVGTKAAGRGGANLAFDDSGYVLHDNPAGLIGATGPSGCCSNLLEVNVGGLFPVLSYSDPQNAETSASNDPFGIGAFTYARRMTDNLAVGVGAYTPAGFGARWNLQGPPGPLAGPQFYKSIGMLVRLLPGFSYQASDRLRVGATFGVAASHVEVEGPYFVNTGPLTGVPTLLDLQATGAAISWSTGFQYQATDQLTVAARYQSQNRFENDGNATIFVPGLGSANYDMTLGIVWPRSAGAGMKYALTPSTRLALDVDWQQWSKAFGTVDFYFRGGQGPPIIDSLPLRWRDAVSLKSGVEYDIRPGRTVRLGYGHNSDAVPSHSANVYIPTILSHYFTAGMGIQNCGWDYDLAYQYSFRPTMHLGASSLAGGDSSFGNLSVQAHWLFLGVSRRF